MRGFPKAKSGWAEYRPIKFGSLNYFLTHFRYRKLREPEHDLTGAPNFIAPTGFAKGVWRKNAFAAYSIMVEGNYDRYSQQVEYLIANSTVHIQARNSHISFVINKKRRIFKVQYHCNFYIFVDPECGRGEGFISESLLKLKEELLFAFAKAEYMVYRNDKSSTRKSRTNIYQG